MANTLEPGKPRVGWLLDGDEGTPTIPAVLEETGSQIRLSVPTQGSFSKETHGRWWHGTSTRFGGDPDRSRYRYAPPRNLLFYDPDGTVVLIGCRAAGMKEALGLRAGLGTIIADYAVLGGRHFRYDAINGLRAQIPALARWTGLGSTRLDSDLDGSNRVRAARLEMNAPEPISVARAMNLTLRPTWQTSRPDQRGRFFVDDVVEAATGVKRPRPWGEHLAAITALRDLVALSGWQKVGITGLKATRDDDPERVLSGDAIGERWATVLTHRIEHAEAEPATPSYLFDFSEIGPAGIRRWLKIRRHFSRAFQPLIAILDQEDSYIETRLLQSSIALDALGYQIGLDTNRITAGRKYEHMAALKHILNDMDAKQIVNPKEWRTRSNSMFRGIKHADNPSPRSVEAANTMRENLLVIRFWLGQKLGAKPENMHSQLSRDPLGRPYQLAEG